MNIPGVRTISFVSLVDICSPEQLAEVEELISDKFTWGDASFTLVQKYDLLAVLIHHPDDELLDTINSLEVDYINL